MRPGHTAGLLRRDELVRGDGANASTPDAATGRWAAIDALRGLSIIAMLLSLTPGAWEHSFGWLVHVRWEGWNLVDMVAPGFLFCIGAVMPVSLRRRVADGDGRVAAHVLKRALGLVLLGVFINAYPEFDAAHLRLPGVLQRIGASYALAAMFVLRLSRRGNRLQVSAVRMSVAAACILASYWALLYFVPVPGYGAQRFDPEGSWPAVIDRAVFTVPHLFRWWPVNGQVVFDPDGLLSIYPTCALILLGVAANAAWPTWRQPERICIAAGGALMALAIGLQGACPIIKNIWTSTFVLFSAGFSLVLLGALTLVYRNGHANALFFPLRVFGANPLLAYLVCFLFAPALDANWLPLADHGRVSLRWGSQLLLAGLDPQAASILFGVAYLTLLFPLLWFAHRRGWFLKL